MLTEVGIKFAEFAGGIGGVFLATNIVKLSSLIPWVKEGDKTKLRAIAGLLSAIVVVLYGLVDKKLTPDSVQGLLASVGTFLAIWGGSHLTHVASNKSPGV